MRRAFATLSVACCVHVAAGPGLAAPADAKCYPTWSEASIVALSQGLVPVERLSQMARSRYKGELVKTTLCLEHGRYVYRLIIRENRGTFKTLTVDAQRPFER